MLLPAGVLLGLQVCHDRAHQDLSLEICSVEADRLDMHECPGLKTRAKLTIAFESSEE